MGIVSSFSAFHLIQLSIIWYFKFYHHNDSWNVFQYELAEQSIPNNNNGNNFANPWVLCGRWDNLWQNWNQPPQLNSLDPGGRTHLNSILQISYNIFSLTQLVTCLALSFRNPANFNGHDAVIPSSDVHTGRVWRAKEVIGRIPTIVGWPILAAHAPLS